MSNFEIRPASGPRPETTLGVMLYSHKDKRASKPIDVANKGQPRQANKEKR